MGVDITTVVQRQVGHDWETVEGLHPFDWRDYGMYGFLADQRNYSAVPPIAEPRGLPSDFERGDAYADSCAWGASWLSVDELLNFDYEASFEDRRVTREVAPNVFDGGCTGDEGEGVVMTYREFLGEGFFNDLANLANYRAGRVVFWFS